MNDLDLTQIAARLSPREVEAHGLAPLVYRSNPMPELREAALRAAAVEPLRLADLRKLLAALHERAIRPLILKGTALAYDLYDAPEHRPRGDVDLLIAKGELDAAYEVFHTLGYRERAANVDEHGLRQQLFLRADDYGVEHAYDVHWDIANRATFAGTLTMADAVRPLPRISEHAFGLARPEALLHACIHRIAHHHDDERLIWLVDIHLLRNAMTREEHARFWRLAAERRVLAVARRSIGVTEQWFGAHALAATDFLSAGQLAAEEASHAYLRVETRGGVLLADLRVLPWRARVTRLRQLAFPPAEFMRAMFPHLRTALPLLYVWRGVRGVVRLFRKVGA
ncbi:MAG TPA: nucleotidyltransferase family protein [Thermoanaerobaculia bacterium]